MDAIISTKEGHIENAFLQLKNDSDKLMDYFLISFFFIGLLFAFKYDTWLIATGVGSLSLIAYYSAKRALPDSNLYQYVLSTVLGIFMAQYIYQWHGLFEMHFWAFIGSAILITYQNWKLQIPLALVVIVHHGSFGYLQYIGYDEIYFTQLEYMPLETFIIHGILATAVFVLCGLWAYNFKIFHNVHIRQSFEIGKLQEADKQKAAIIEEREKGEKELERSFSLLEATLESTADGILVADYDGNIVLHNKKFEELWRMPKHILASKDDDKAIGFVLDQLVNPEAFISKVKELYNSRDSVSYDILEFIDGRTFERYSQPQMINGESVGRVWSFRDITERKHGEEERDKMLTDIVQRNKDLEQFTYIISHNLRAPVANILGFSEALKDETTEEDRKEFVEAISESTHKLDNVISDLNLILQLKEGKGETKEPVRFSDLVNDIKLSINKTMEKEDVLVETDFSEIDEYLTLKSYMYSVFYNLISNSIKYRQPGIAPVIKITSHKYGKKFYLSFKDNGMGIDLEQKGNQVFGLYKRFHTDAAEGKGVGLFMTKTQVETMGGKINIKSAVNKGTEFKIEFDY